MFTLGGKPDHKLKADHNSNNAGNYTTRRKLTEKLEMCVKVDERPRKQNMIEKADGSWSESVGRQI